MRLFDRILEELGWPEIYLVSPEQFEKLEEPPYEYWGMSGARHPVIAIVGKQDYKNRRNTIYHEILHLLFPHREHWWIECAAKRLARGGEHGEWSKKYGKTMDDVPDRKTIVKMCVRASRKFNERKK